MTHARVVIIGGGIAGCSVAYHLVKLGWRDVVLLERKQLTSGTTWHAAGLIGRLRGSRTMAGLVRYSAELYARLEAETGVSTNWKQVGSLGVARRAARMTQFRRSVALGRYAGIEAHIVDRDDVRRRWPLCRIDDLEGGIWIPHDGRVIPADTTQALAAGARAGGARIMEDTAVREVLTRDGRVAGVRTSAGEIACEIVVNCAGMWARELGALNGVTIPVFPVEHFYAVTRPIAGVSPDLPVLRDYDGHIYVREEVGGLLFGGFEPVAKPWHERVPDDFAFGTLKEDWEQFRVLMDNGSSASPRSRRRRSSSCSTAPRASRPTAASSSARRRACAGTSSPPASTRVGSRTRAGPAARSPSGSSAATCRWTSGRWIRAASRRSTASHAFSPSACVRCRDSTTGWRGRSASTKRGAACSAQRSTTV